jgi:hypothetical protein
MLNVEKRKMKIMNKTYHILNKVAKKGMSALLLAPLALVSCNDFLDQVPD